MAVFGGTFDPPHVGHLVVASEVRYRGGFDEVLMAPFWGWIIAQILKTLIHMWVTKSFVPEPVV